MNCIVFDKTGTLTTGKPVVVCTRLLKRMVLHDFYECVAAAEVSLSFPFFPFSCEGDFQRAFFFFLFPLFVKFNFINES